MSLPLSQGVSACTDGVRLYSNKARRREPSGRSAGPAASWPAWTDRSRWSVLHPESWPAWTSEIRVGLSERKVSP